jgi:hypothetical protein
VDHALDVDGEHAVPFLLGEVVEQAEGIDAGDLAEDVDAAVPLEGMRGQRLHIGAVCNIGPEERGFSRVA